MLTSSRIGIIAVAAACLLGGTLAGEAVSSMLSKDQVLQLLPQGVDLDDEAIAKYQKLVLAGEEAYPALVELLDQAEDRVLVSNILSVFVDSHGDKAVPIEAVKKLIARNIGPDKRAVDVRISAVMALGRIGRREDRESVMALLDDGDEKVRINTLRTISRLGSQADVARIRDFVLQRKNRLSPEEVPNDYSLIEAEKAIKDLQNKID